MSASSSSNTKGHSDDPRLGSILRSGVADKRENASEVCIGLLGVPCDIGVYRNGGRPGSDGGPNSLREHLRKVGPLYNPEFDIDISSTKLHDFGNVEGWVTLEEMHPLLTANVEAVLKLEYLPIMIGGGNDQSYCNARGFMNFLGHGRIAVINIDAHLDVRKTLGEDNLAHSGSPFRQLLLDDTFQGQFVEFAAQGNQCSKNHADFVTSKGGRIYWLSQVRRAGPVAAFESVLSSFPSDMPVFMSFDIDSIQSADCPGVSCPASIGLTSQEAVDICFLAGRTPNVRLVDFSEYNPKVESYRSGRLLANMIYYFIMGRHAK